MEAVEHVIELLGSAQHSDYIGEPVSQATHMLQAGLLAQAAVAQHEDPAFADAFALAALLHDVGHLCDPDAPQMEGLGAVAHERLGARWLEALGFGQTVARLVEGHVAAKRYLAARRPGYRARLSPASTRTLELQGGVMTEAEATAFEADPLFEWHLKLRRIDEAAKSTTLAVPSPESWRPVCLRHLRRLRG